MRVRLFNPFWLPVYFFTAGILLGAVALTLPWSAVEHVPFVDALFMATSAMCVTGLATLDPGSTLTFHGQAVLLLLAQCGGLGIMTFTSLAFYLMGKHVSLTDRIAVGQSLLHDPSFSLGRFLLRVVFGTLIFEGLGAVALWVLDPVSFGPWSAIFHAISAFCNAGLSLFPDSLMRFADRWDVNAVFMVLIVVGGLGFAVLNELLPVVQRMVREGPMKVLRQPHPVLSWHARIVLKTTFVLIFGGAVIIFLAEWEGGRHAAAWPTEALRALFQSITCRTAGFNTVNIPGMTEFSLVIMLALMVIGGSPGSTAGGLKTTTAAVWWAFICAQFTSTEQVTLGRRAFSRECVAQALRLVIFAVTIIFVATLLLLMTEGGDAPHAEAHATFLEVLFEVVSAFATTGLSMGMTGSLTVPGKLVIIMLMFVGRLGPIWLLSALNSWQKELRYRLPEDDLPIG